MNAFLRRLAAMGVLTTLCDMLLPEGGTRRAVQLTVGVMTTALLLSAFLSVGQQLMGAQRSSDAVASVAAASVETSVYRQTALQALTNQTADYCERVARSVGYVCTASVTLDESGACTAVRLCLTKASPMISENELLERLARALSMERSQIGAVEP